SPLPADELPPHQTEETLAAALKHDPIAVLVCNPTALHLSTALEAAAAGCHLFLEKPVSHQLGGVEQLVEIAAEKNLLVQV
ncbi:MAG: Gfo/Idh/MocA family oxidoreductase, partial [Saprospiraceae bacterium]|nr:Gfo/Idh/MocA family oxidoreductase [Saprospiraceae bacterium]